MASAIGKSCSVAVVGTLAGQRRPALEGAEHAAHRRRGNFLDLGSAPGFERVVVFQYAAKHMAIHRAVIGRIDPAIDRSRIDMRR
jgi:hypothetical protein